MCFSVLHREQYGEVCAFMLTLCKYNFSLRFARCFVIMVVCSVLNLVVMPSSMFT